MYTTWALLLSIVFSPFAFSADIIVTSQSEMRILSALGDALGRPKELNYATTSTNLQTPISSLLNVKYPIYTDDTAMAVVTELSLRELIEHLKKNNIDISDHFQNFDLAALHAFLQGNNSGAFPGAQIEKEILNVFGSIVAKQYLHYYSYWAQPGRAPGIGCMSAIEGNKMQLLNQDGAPSVKKQMNMYMGGIPFWWNCGAGKTDKTYTGGGNGALMRTYPCAMMFHAHPVFAAALALVHSHITHSASIGALPTVVFTYGVVKAYNAKVLGQDLFLNNIIDYLLEGADLVGLPSQMNDIQYYYQLGQKNKKVFEQSVDKKAAFIEVWDTHFDILGKLNSNTWTGIGALHAAVYMMSLFVESDNPAQALQWSAHIKGDTDSVGTLVGTLLSTMYTIEELRACSGSTNGVFSNSLLRQKNIELLEDYEYLSTGQLEKIIARYNA